MFMNDWFGFVRVFVVGCLAYLVAPKDRNDSLKSGLLYSLPCERGLNAGLVLKIENK